MYLTKLHSNQFITQWKKLLQASFGYEEYMDFLIVRTITGKKVLSYLPLLNYTDRESENIDDLLELSKDNEFSIRTLNVDNQKFEIGKPVTMRLDIKEKNFDDLMKNSIVSKCRNQVRKSKKSDLYFEIGNNKEQISDFYYLFSKTMHNYGTPSFSKSFFEEIPLYMDSNYLITYKDNVPIAALLMLYDETLAWIPWAASNREYTNLCPNHFLYMSAIIKAISDDKEIFDFGRSEYGGHTYKFKSQWGAKPIGITVVSSNKDNNVYSKYKFVSKVWKKLPFAVTSLIGPKLTKYLEDL